MFHIAPDRSHMGSVGTKGVPFIYIRAGHLRLKSFPTLKIRFIKKTLLKKKKKGAVFTKEALPFQDSFI